MAQEKTSSLLNKLEFNSGNELLASGDENVNSGNYNMALNFYEKSLSFFKESHNLQKTAIISKKLALVHFYLANYELSLDFGVKSLESFKNSKDTIQIIEALNVIGLNYAYLKKYKKAKDKFDIALNLILKNKDVKHLNRTLNNVSTLYYLQENFEMSFVYDKKCLVQAKLLNDSLAIAASYNNIGGNLVNMGMLDSALHYYNLSLLIVCSLEDIQREAITLGNIGEVLSTTKSSTEGITMIERSLNLAYKSGDRKLILNNYERLITNYEKLKKYDSTSHYLHKWITLNDSINTEEVIENIANTESKLKLEKAYSKIEIYKANSKTSKIEKELLKSKTKSLSVILLAISIIVVLVLLRFLQKRKLNEKDILLKKQKAILFEIQLENSKILNNKLESDLKKKSEQLSLIAINTANRTKSLEQITKLTKELAGSNHSDKINQILDVVKEAKQQSNDWENLKNIFNEVHIDFFSKLKSNYPKLTKNDLRHCAYIKMQMNTKEIANLLNITTSSVQIARVRLKKKLDLSKEQHLFDYIMKY